MGGILSKVGFEPHETITAAVLEQMLDASAGPGDAVRRLHVGPGFALGACIASASATQSAIATGSRHSLIVCADARLTNAASLRTELADLGHRIERDGDAALIVRAYEHWGIDAFARLRGPFACAIWDGDARRLVVARDHLGIQPLYFAVLPDHGVVVASHTRALLREPGIQRDWCPAAIDAYLTLGYVPAPLSPHRRISKLEAGHVLIVEGRRLHVEAYWDLPTASRTNACDREVTATVAAHLRRVSADAARATTTGLLYSGGTASTTLLSVSPGTHSVVTSSWDADANDLARSERAASLLGHTRHLDTTTPDVAMLARQLAASCDEPIGDPAAITQFAAYRAMREYTDTAVSGLGAATLWADHARHRVERLESIARTWLVGPLASLTGGVGRSLPESMKGVRALTHLALPAATACAVKHAYGLWDDDHRRTLYTRGFAWDVKDRSPFARHLELHESRGSSTLLDRALYVDARTFLPDSLLTMAAVAARAAGLDVRFPLLDVDFAAYVAALPMQRKRHGSHGMHGLRSVLMQALPAALLPTARRTPVAHAWLPAALTAMVPQMLLGSRFDERGIVSRPALRRLWHEHVSGRVDHAHRLWSLVSLELWFRNVIDGDAEDTPLEYAIVTSRRAGTPASGAAIEAA